MAKEWIRSGCQRKAVALAIKKPMTSSEIFTIARATSKRIRLRNISTILRDMTNKQYLSCINKQASTGRLYYLTNKGRQVIFEAFGIKRTSRPRNINWKMYSLLIRGKTRREVFLELHHLATKSGDPQTISSIRRSLTKKYPIAMNATIRAINEIHKGGLISCSDKTKKGRCRMFKITHEGENIARVLKF